MTTLHEAKQPTRFSVSTVQTRLWGFHEATECVCEKASSAYNLQLQLACFSLARTCSQALECLECLDYSKFLLE
jgi:hypothetical protein